MFNTCVPRRLGCFLLLALASDLPKALGLCPRPNKQNCFPPIGDTCITSVQNGTGLNWFEMEDACSKDGGRLVLMRDKFEKTPLLGTLSHISNKILYDSVQFLAVGMLTSQNDTVLWRNNLDNETDNYLLSSATQTQCRSVDGCWRDGVCRFTEQHSFTIANLSAEVNTGALNTTSRRVCVGMDKTNSSWMAYSCSTPAVAATGYACEYKCKDEWPVDPRQNITCTFTEGNGKSNQGGEKNNSATIMKKKMALVVCIGLLSLVNIFKSF